MTTQERRFTDKEMELCYKADQTATNIHKGWGNPKYEAVQVMRKYKRLSHLTDSELYDLYRQTADEIM